MHDLTARKKAEGALRQLSGRLLRLQDEERRRIAMQLHDSTAQSLIALKLELAKARRFSAADDSLRKSLDDALGLAEQSIGEIRTLSYLLHPPMIDEIGLVASLEWFVRGFEERTAIRVLVDADRGMGRLPQAVETAVFRIVQEALNNIQRHSQSKSATIRLARDSEGIQVTIEDAGRGMPEPLRSVRLEVMAAAGVGIAGMLQRAKDLDGRMSIHSDGGGTRIEVRLPIPGS
jgi:signal transduction histidine kinase